MKNILIILGLLINTNILAKSVKCTYNYKNKSIIVGNLTSKRTVVEYPDNKTGKKYRIFIKDIDNLSEVEDYIEIKNKKGHSITFSLKCN